jgi:hypothetical protein
MLSSAEIASARRTTSTFLELFESQPSWRPSALQLNIITQTPV